MKALESRQVRNEGFRNAATRAVLEEPAHRFEPPTDGLDPRAAAGYLARALPKGALVTCGAGHFFSFPAMYMALPEGTEIQFSYQFGAVGQGMPLAIGTGAGNPGRPHVAIEGDGSLLFHIQELDTITRFKMQMVLIVWNDGGYGAEVHKLLPKGFEWGRRTGTRRIFVAIAKAFGGDGVKLEKKPICRRRWRRDCARAVCI